MLYTQNRIINILFENALDEINIREGLDVSREVG